MIAINRGNIAACVVLFTLSAAFGNTYYVSAGSGSDNAAGTIDAPFLTIQKAADVMEPGDTCAIRTGIYRETVIPAAGGSTGWPMVFMAYQGEQVFISAADPVTGWTKDNGDIYKASMGWDLGKGRNQLFANGEMMLEARLPNIDAEPTNSDNNNIVYPTRRAVDKAYFGKHLLNPAFIACGSQQDIAGPIKVWIGAPQDGDGKVRMVPFFDSCRTANAPQDFIAGALVQRAVAGYSADHGTVISGWGMESGSALNGWMYITVDPTTPNFGNWWFGGGGVIFSGLRCFLDAENEWALENGTVYFRPPNRADPNTLLVEAKRRQLVMDLSGLEYVYVQGLNCLGGSINMNGSNNCVIDDCHLRYITHYTLSAHYTDDKLTGESAVYIKGNANKFINSSIEYSAASGIYVIGDGNLVENCLISNCDYLGNYEVGAAIGADGPGENTLTRCTMYNFGRSALTFSASCKQDYRYPLNCGQIITYNNMYNSMFMVDDGGTFYMHGVSCGGTEFAYNWMHDMVRKYNCHHIYCDLAGGYHYLIHHNVFWQQHGESPNNSITTAPMRHITYNNTSVSVDPYIPDKQYQAYDDDERGVNALWVDGDPVGWGLADWEHHDFTLVEGSPAIDAGTFDADSQYMHLWDFEGYRQECYLLDTPYVVHDSMVVGSAPDLGAYEYGKPRWVPGHDWGEVTWEYPPSSAGLSSPEAMRTARVSMHYALSRNGLMVFVARAPSYAVQLLNLAGRTITTQSAQGGERLLIPSSAMPAGVMLMRIREGNMAKTFRLNMLK